LGACRAMLLGLLLPDPCDDHCPEEFKKKARELLPKVQGEVGPTGLDLRQALLKFIGDFANWDLSSDRTYLEVSRGLVKAAHPEETPLVVDPFAGGGSIPLEALRLGCEAFASDLNPVACFILKVLLEDIPRNTSEVAEELRRVGAEIKATVEQSLAEFYPLDPDGARPVAYLWARTVRCEQPDCGAEIPLVRSFWLCTKASRKRGLRFQVKGRNGEGKAAEIEFEIFEPKTDREVPAGTVNRARASCPYCHMVLSPERVCAQLAAQRGGADVIFDERGRRVGGARLLTVVMSARGEEGRSYRLPTQRDYEAVWKAMAQLRSASQKPLTDNLSAVPNEPLPPIGTLGFRVQRYGMVQWGDLFTARQKLMLVTLARTLLQRERGGGIDQAVADVAGIGLSRLADISNSLCSWKPSMTQVIHVFTRQALPIVWDYAEAAPLGEQAGDYSVTIGNLARIPEAFPVQMASGQIQVADATSSPIPDASVNVWFTDPPYYDAVPYADLSDFFFVWLKRAVLGHPLLRDPFDLQNPLTPKTREAVQDETKTVKGRKKDGRFFEETMGKAFAEGRRVLKVDGIGAVVFAHKTTEGWEALLSGMIRGGWTITGSWPIATEMGSRLRARESAALATSVHLVCRPRPEDAPVGDWGEVLRELPKRVGEWMERLQSEGIRGADLVFACIGPALEIFSRYSKVETAEGREVKLPEYLEKVWEVVGRTALEQVLGTADLPAATRLRADTHGQALGAQAGAQARNGLAGALEEDARLTALFLWTLQSTNGEDKEKGKSKKEKEEYEAREEELEEDEDEEEEGESKKGKGKSKKGYSLVFDVVRRFAQPLGIHLEDWEDRIIETEKGVVRLLSVTDRAKQLFGQDGAEVVAEELERRPERAAQMALFSDRGEGAAPEIKGRGRRKKKVKVSGEGLDARREATTLDRVHAAMLLQASGRTNALRALLKAEQDRGPDFLRLANALSALYPRGSEEKRLLDAMLLAVPR
jgi:putative DNA methylase